MRKNFLAIFAVSSALTFSAFTSDNSPKPATTYYYFDGAWRVYPGGEPCPPGKTITCRVMINGVERTIFKSQNFGDPLKYD